ncbi:hypothetical protein [Mesorhizobium sp. M0011]|uniref:hypothetical protein n=1 Tax=Mesorhizobium sp. M0011 TaxID=2956839 RepID=UPI003337225F
MMKMAGGNKGEAADLPHGRAAFSPAFANHERLYARAIHGFMGRDGRYPCGQKPFMRRARDKENC